MKTKKKQSKPMSIKKPAVKESEGFVIPDLGIECLWVITTVLDAAKTLNEKQQAGWELVKGPPLTEVPFDHPHARLFFYFRRPQKETQ